MVSNLQNKIKRAINSFEAEEFLATAFPCLSLSEIQSIQDYFQDKVQDVFDSQVVEVIK